MIANKKYLIAFAIAGLLAVHPAFADKPEHAGGNGKNGRDQGQASQQKQSHKNDQKESKKKNEGHKQNKKNDETRSASAKHDGNSSRRNDTDHSRKQLSNRSNDDRRSGDGRRDNDVSINVNFNDRQRTYLHDYYREEFSRGHCPPGLAKKNNGCMPPGQAKKWRKGYRLDRDIVYYDLPPSVIIELGQPPRGYKYVRVAADILMIAIGTGLVVDAVADLSDM